MYLPVVVPTEKSFFFLGGNTGFGGFSDTILEFDNYNEAWIEREERLMDPKYGFFAVSVEESTYCE